jgi:peptidoglycan/LPS O-acetylase OafA/YrhL
MTRLKYSPDIDGLRAIAVLGVVIFHAFPKALPGGFIGVDIFFVISGYLISGILYKGHNTGNFSFKEFYSRRVRRIFPSLITVLLLCLGYGWLILLPDEYERLGRHVASGTLFIQNFVFWQESGYFDTASNLKPMLHLWSLAVEEQFYILFPPILFLVWKRKWPLVLVLTITPYRAWEFLGGSLLAWWHFNRGSQPPGGDGEPWSRQSLSLGGVVILGLGMAFIHKGDPYPGWRALAPVAGTLLIIHAGGSAWVNRCLLSHPAIVWIGLISYPLYLFHWPALSFVHIVKDSKPHDITIWSALAVAFVLTVITYYFIERPIRYSRSPRVVALLSAAFIITGIIAMLVSYGLIPIRSGFQIGRIDEALKDRDLRQGLEVMKGMRWVWVKHIGGNGPQTLFLGDCHIQQYTSRITEILKDNTANERGGWFVTAGGAPPVDGVSNKKFRACRELMPAFWKTLDANPRIDRVVIGAHWLGYAGDDGGEGYFLRDQPLTDFQTKVLFMRELDMLVGKLCDRNIKVCLIQSVPTGPELDPEDMIERSFIKLYMKKPGSLKTQDFISRAGWVRTKIQEMGRNNRAEVIDPVFSLSKEGYCINQDEAGPIRFDAVHLRPGYVKKNVKYVDHTVLPK